MFNPSVVRWIEVSKRLEQLEQLDNSTNNRISFLLSDPPQPDQQETLYSSLLSLLIVIVDQIQMTFSFLVLTE